MTISFLPTDAAALTIEVNRPRATTNLTSVVSFQTARCLLLSLSMRDLGGQLPTGRWIEGRTSNSRSGEPQAVRNTDDMHRKSDQFVLTILYVPFLCPMIKAMAS
jgi:hypothetical protein